MFSAGTASFSARSFCFWFLDASRILLAARRRARKGFARGDKEDALEPEFAPGALARRNRLRPDPAGAFAAAGEATGESDRSGLRRPRIGDCFAFDRHGPVPGRFDPLYQSAVAPRFHGSV